MELDISEDLVQSPNHKAAGHSETTLDGLLHQRLKLYEDLKEGCGGQLWPAGMVLAKYLLRKPEDVFRVRSIVELGAGGGLVGLALGLSFHPDSPSSTIYITDQEPMLALMQRNISLNNLESRVSASVLNWGEEIPPDIPQPPDIILAGDCVYYEPAFQLLQQTLEQLIGETTVCYFCFKKRRRADTRFMKAARRVFDVKEVDDDPDKACYSRENIFLYTITKKRRKEN